MEFSFVQGDKYESTLALLYVAFWFAQWCGGGVSASVMAGSKLILVTWEYSSGQFVLVSQFWAKLLEFHTKWFSFLHI